MLKLFIRRLFAGAAPESNADLLRSGGSDRSTIVETRQPPIPGVIQIATTDVISQLFDRDVARQEMEFNRRK